MLSTALPLAKLPFDIAKINESVFSILPKLGKTAFAVLPFSIQQKVLLAGLSNIFSEEIADGDFEFLEQKWLNIVVTDLDLSWFISYQDEQLVIADSEQSKNITANVSFSANGDDLLLIAGRKQDPDTLFFKRRLVIEGDTELGLEIKNLIDAIDVERLPKVLNQVIQKSADWIEQVKPQTP